MADTRNGTYMGPAWAKYQEYSVAQQSKSMSTFKHDAGSLGLYNLPVLVDL